MKSVISTGLGRLHLFEAARAIANVNTSVDLITGWVPAPDTPEWLINSLGWLVGRSDLASGMRKRRVDETAGVRTISLAAPEFTHQMLRLISKFGLANRDWTSTWGWQRFGLSSKPYLGGADVFHVRSGAGRGGVIELARKRGIPVVADHSIAHPITVNRNLAESFDQFGRKPEIDPNSRFWTSVMHDCRDADLILVNSDYVKESLTEQGFGGSQIEVAWLGIPKEFIGAKSDWKRQDRLRLLFTGAFDLRKGGHIILDAMQELRERRIDFHLDVIGVPHPSLLSYRRADEASDITFHGFIPRDQLPRYLESADIYVFPSFAEGAAQSATEAMGAGVPVVATREAGVPIVDGETGLLVPRGDAAAVADQIERLSDNELLRATIGAAGAAHVAANHTWESYGELVRSIYRRVTSQPNL